MNAGRPIPLWPGRPRPLPGETFSSWFSRTAWSNGLTPAELYGVATNGAQIHSRDLDRLAERPLRVRLSAATGISADILADAMVTRWGGHLYAPALAARMLDDWPHRFHATCEAAGVSRWQLERTSSSPMTLLK
ncbi:TniQ family protein [Paramagnetospirillum magneticum]|uniref:TniQ domain-containing protein n=1 Tax=Paramagnetospirillum magneticum (strain ATCC 700264 / AMB-1) TaxID=342108 RepID=Q2W364_PARM1|nr:TniQ family protein [Paramagnetospirillum magneticum]BAE51711.1 hypothetical protein amb2907 [Paramagnetospirillum magneticum AMB-1]